MPMPNLRHQLKSGRKERRTGAAAPDADRCVLPKITQQAPAYQEHGLASHEQSLPEPAFTHLPKIPADEKPRRARPASSRVRLPAVETAKQPTSGKDIHGLTPANWQYKPNAPSSSKPSRARAPSASVARAPSASVARAPSASVRLPAIQKAPAETTIKISTDQSYSDCSINDLPYQPKPPAGGKPRRNGGHSVKLSSIPETPATRPHRLPTLVQNDTTRFNNPPKCCEPVAEKATKTPIRRWSGVGYGVASGDMNTLALENGNNNTCTRDMNKRSRRRGSGHTSDDDDDIVDSSSSAESDEPVDPTRRARIEPVDPTRRARIEPVDPTRRARIERLSKVFDVLVLATAMKIEHDKIKYKEKKKSVNNDMYRNSD